MLHVVHAVAVFLLLAAVFGSLVVPLVYYISREFRVSMPSSLFSAWLAAFDMIGVIESRTIVTDAQLLFYIALTLLVAVKFWKRRNYFTHLQELANSDSPQHKPGSSGNRRRASSISSSNTGRSKGKSVTVAMPLLEEITWSALLGLCCGAAVRYGTML